jgi:hypothetical protein
MIDIKISEEKDVVKGDDYCRPLALLEPASVETSVYGNMPINNLKWVPVHAIYGKFWNGKTIGEMCPKKDAEFCRGELTKEHLLSKGDNWLESWN